MLSIKEVEQLQFHLAKIILKISYQAPLLLVNYYFHCKNNHCIVLLEAFFVADAFFATHDQAFTNCILANKIFILLLICLFPPLGLNPNLICTRLKLYRIAADNKLQDKKHTHKIEEASCCSFHLNPSDLKHKQKRLIEMLFD